MSKTSKRIAVLGAAVLLSPMVWQAGASAAPATVCDGTETLTDSYRSVVVPEGKTCYIDGATVTGQVQARRDSILYVDNSDIKQVHGLKAEKVQIDNGSDISKHVHIQQGDENTEGTDVRVRDSEVGGNIHVHHNVGTIQIKRTIVGGHIQLQHNRSHLVIKNNTVGKNLQVLKTTNDVNTSKVVTGNKVAGQIQCRGNEMPFKGSGNESGKKIQGQCST